MITKQSDTMKPYRPLPLILALAFLVPTLAHATIGSIGSSATSSNPPAKNTAHDESTAKSASDRENSKHKPPIIVISFQQSHNYYDRQLSHAISDTESKQPGVSYQVVSYIPDQNGSESRIHNGHVSEAYNDNLQGVLKKMHDLGVPDERIKVNTVSKTEIDAQQIEIRTQQ